MSKDFHIRNFNENDFESIIQIANSRFGNDYIQKQELAHYLKEENKIGVVALINNEIVGFALAQTCDLKTLLDIVLCKQEWFNEHFIKVETIGLLKTIAVDSNYTNQGIGKALTEYRIKELHKQAKSLLAISWRNKNNSANVHILEKIGFTLKLEIENYWGKDSITKGYDCIVCGKPPCNCEALIYTIKLFNLDI